MSADYYLVPGSLPVSAKMHILTNGLANIGSTDGQLVTNAASTLSLSVNGNVNSGGNIGGSVGVTTAPYYSLNPTGGTSGTAIIIPNGPTSERPPLAYSLAGYLRYNTDSYYSTLEYYRKKQDVYLQLYSPPNVTSISPTTLKLNVGTPDASINISGSNFDTNYPMSVIFYTKNFVASYIAPSIKINSSASMTVTVPTGVYNGSSASSNSPYTIRVISEFTGMGYTFVNALTVVDGSFSFTAPSSLNTVYTSRSYSRATFIAGTYGTSVPPPPQIVATYEGITVTNYKFNPASAGYIDVVNNSLTIDASGFITGTIKNGYVATTKTVSVGVIAGSNSSYDTSANTNLNLTFAPLLLSTTSSLSQNSIVTSTPTYTYYYYEVTNTNQPTIAPSTSTIPSSNNPTQGAAASVSATITLGPSIVGTSIYSADPSYSYMDFLIVGGGGGGGCGWQGGGGGAGGLVSSGNNPNYTYGYTIGSSGGGGSGVGPYQVPQGITTPVTITVSVGGGGAGGYVYYSSSAGPPYSGRSGNGSNSYITFPTGDTGSITYTAYGGGGGGGEQDQPAGSPQIITGTNFMPFPGGSGGGSSHGPYLLFSNAVFTAIYGGSSGTGAAAYTLNITGITSGSICPLVPVYEGSTPTGTPIGYISTFGTNGTTGTGQNGGSVPGTYYLTGLTTTSSTSSFPTTALATGTALSSRTFCCPSGAIIYPSTSYYYVTNGFQNGTASAIVSNYSVGYNSQGFNDTISGYQGYNGGYGVTNGFYSGGGGGGAGAPGSNSTSTAAGTGGIGLRNYIKTATFATAGTGVYYAGGGGGSARAAAATNSGGNGGGGNGQNLWTSGTSDASFNGLGGGGGAAGNGGGPPSSILPPGNEISGRGGGGSVIIRYRGA